MINSDFIRQLYEKEAEHLYYFARKMVEDAELAHDIVQETFCVAVRKKEEVLNHPEPEAWLYCTAKYVILSECRKKQKRGVLNCYEDMEEILTDEQAEWEFSKVEEDREVLSVLTESECEIVELVYGQGYKTKEAAHRLSMNENTLRVKLLRIRNKLERTIKNEA